MNATKLQNLGWTPEKLRERIAGCRKGLKEIQLKNRPDTAWSYRFLFVSLYRKYKNWLFILESVWQSSALVYSSYMNAQQISLAKVAQNEGYKTVNELILGMGEDSVMPACCSEGCDTEPDGYCEHGFPSILMAAGMI